MRPRRTRANVCARACRSPQSNNELNAALKIKINKLLICCCSPATLTCYLFPNTLRSPFGQSLPGFGPKCAWSGGCHGLCSSRTVAVFLPSCIRHGHRPRSSDLNQLRKLLSFMPTAEPSLFHMPLLLPPRAPAALPQTLTDADGDDVPIPCGFSRGQPQD
jgi:hypothetical protein